MCMNTTLSSVGSSAVKIGLSGAIDIKQLIENPLESKINLQFSPAANVFVTCQMGFNAYAFETALEVAGTIYTNTGTNTSIEVQGGGSLVITTVPTVKDQYVIDFTHQISTVSQESGLEAVKVPVKFKSAKDRETEICFDQVDFLTGFTFCTNINYTAMNITENAHWPLHGNNHFKLEMVDAITFRGEFDDKDSQKPGISFFYDTTKGGVARQSFLKFLSSFNSQHFMGGFDLSVANTPDNTWTITAAAGLVNEDSLKKLYLYGNYLGGPFKHEIGFSRKGVHSSLPTCGTPEKATGTIVRGKDFDRGDYPWMVALYRKTSRGTKYFCGASVISDRHVLTAAHCLEGLVPRDIIALFGAYDLDNHFEVNRFSQVPSRIFVHDHWNPYTTKFDADIAILLMPDKIFFSTFVLPICLWESQEDPSTSVGIVAGWGQSENDAIIHEATPKKLELPFHTNENCFLTHYQLGQVSSNRTFCAGLGDGRGPCSGDSGGGFYVLVGNVFYLKGIVSSSMMINGQCILERYTIYTDVLKFKSWIDATMKKEL